MDQFYTNTNSKFYSCVHALLNPSALMDEELSSHKVMKPTSPMEDKVITFFHEQNKQKDLSKK